MKRPKWEPVVGDVNRLRILGGWLYETSHDAVVFVPYTAALDDVLWQEDEPLAYD